MAKIYEVTVPDHAGGGKYRVTAKSESRVREMICEKLKRTRVPKGTVIKKVGITKSKEKTETPLETPQPKKTEVSLKQRAKKPSVKKEKKKPVDPLDVTSMKLSMEKRMAEKEKKEQEKEEKEKENCTLVNGLYLKNEDKVKLKSKMDFQDASLFIMEKGKPNPIYIGEDAVLTIKRGTELWLYLDHTQDKLNEKELLNHI